MTPGDMFDMLLLLLLVVPIANSPLAWKLHQMDKASNDDAVILRLLEREISELRADMARDHQMLIDQSATNTTTVIRPEVPNPADIVAAIEAALKVTANQIKL